MALPAVAAFGFWKAVTYISVAISGAYATKKIAENWGNTARNDLANQGIPPEKQYADWQKWKNDRQKYLEDKIDSLFKDAKDRKKELEEANKKLLKQLEDRNLSTQEKAKIQEMVDKNQAEINEINKELNIHIERLNKSMESFGTERMNQTEFQAKSNSINWKSWTNYGIIFVAVILLIVIAMSLTKLIKSLFNSIS